MRRPSRYRLWGLGYLALLVLSSPALQPTGRWVSSHLLPTIRGFYIDYFPSWGLAKKNDLLQHFALQALLCNFALLLFSIVETFVKGRRTSFDIAAAMLFGAAAVINGLLFVFLYSKLDFLYVTAGFAALYVTVDAWGLQEAKRHEPEMADTFRYSLAFVDAPTLAVSMGLLAPHLSSHLDYPMGFTDGVGAAVLLFSGCAWTSLMVFFIGKRSIVAPQA